MSHWILVAACLSQFACSNSVPNRSSGDQITHSSNSSTFYSPAVSASLEIKNEMKLGFISDITTLDPHFSFMDINSMTTRLIYNSLFKFGSEKQVNGDLAKSWKMDSSNPMIWKISLRKDVYFQKGQKFTKRDVLCTYERILSHPNQPGGYQGQLKSLDMKRTFELNEQNSNPNELFLVTKESNRFLPSDLASVYILSCEDVKKIAALSATDTESVAKGIIGAKVKAAFDSRDFVNGTGEYEVRSWIPYSQGKEGVAHLEFGKKMSEANSDLVKKILIYPIPDANLRAQYLQSGLLDFISDVKASDVDSLKSKGFKVVQKPSLRMIHVKMAFQTADRENDPKYLPLKDRTGNSYPTPFGSPNFREAMYRAIDKSKLAAVMEGLLFKTGQYMPPGTVGHMSDIPGEMFDLTEARRLFALASEESNFEFLKKQDLVLTIHGPNDRYPNDGKILEALAKLWTTAFGDFQVNGKRYSLSVVAKPESKATYFSSYNKYLFSLLGGGVDNGHAEGALRLYFVPGSALNSANYSNSRVSELYEKGARNPNEEIGDQQLTEALRVAIEDRAILPLYNQIGTWAMKGYLNFNPKVDEMVEAENIR